MQPCQWTAEQPGQWTAEQANAWYAEQPFLNGCNFLPSTAVNDVEMWQSSTFDEKTIDRELGWAAEKFGINTVRVFLNYVVWEAEAEKYKANFARFLDIADKHKIRVMPVPFDDCNFSSLQAEFGPQPEPVPGVHNSRWVSSPPQKMLADKTNVPKLKAYLQDFVKTFGQDKRIVIWDLYNEPGNNGAGTKYLDFVLNVFAWAREVKPSQPLTIGAWHEFNSGMSKKLRDDSDIVSFHSYGNHGSVAECIQWAKSTGRPAVCTEWLHRQGGNTVEATLPLFKENKIGVYNWGCVAGKTQTYFHWGSKQGTPEPKIWQHDLMHKDGKPYSQEEADLFKSLR